ncbi:MAG: N-6 DNA methylase [Deltaproteobacteria bacterium]|nr:N-6 DNA methylase [Deltaproteobacteria bacterium]
MAVGHDLETFRATLTTLVAEARAVIAAPKAALAGQKPEDFTKDRFLVPFLDALGYDRHCRVLEGKIPSLARTVSWCDYFLLPAPNRRPWCMVEAKSILSPNVWTLNRQQVVDYLKDYQAEVSRQNDREAVPWIILTNFKEFHFLRLHDSEPFWSLGLDDLEANADALFDRLARGEQHRNHLDEYYLEKEHDRLTPRFLADLKVWRLLLANGIREAKPDLNLEWVGRWSQQLLNRMLFTRLLEAYGQEAYNSMLTTFEIWRSLFNALPFSTFLSQNRWKSTWIRYNTELFNEGPLDKLVIAAKWFEPLLRRDAALSGEPAAVAGALFGGRSLYNYDFHTLSHDILGKAYEQFLAHELVEAGDGRVKILENQATRQREGIFYTPDYVVQHIVRLTLQPRVVPCLAAAKLALDEGRFVEARQAAMAILSIRIVDPACGSGSLLIGALRYLADAVEGYNQLARLATLAQQEAGLSAASGQPKPIDDVVERVLVHCIHGVDLDGEAVDLAKLSLWSQLLRAQPGRYGRQGEAHGHLPVLALNLRHGNSLVQSPLDSDEFAEQRTRAAELADAARDLGLPDEERLKSAQDLDGLVASLADQVRSRLPLAQLDDADPAVRARRRPFHWELEFPGVFDVRRPEAERGFDVVVGNPPYFNVDLTWGKGSADAEYLSTYYPDIHTDKTDVLFYFFRRGYDLLRDRGDLGFIVSRAFLQGDKSKKLRAFLASRTTLLHLLDFLGQRVFQAGIATAILHWRKGEAPDGHALDVCAALDLASVRDALVGGEAVTAGAVTFQVLQQGLRSDKWSLSPFQPLFRQIDEGRPSLGSRWRVGQGMQTGENDVFVFGPDSTLASAVPTEFVRRRVSNANLRAFAIEDTGERVLWFDGLTYDALPQAIREHLERFRDRLSERAACIRGNCAWYQFTWPLHEDVHFGAKVVAPYRASAACFAVDESGQWLGLTNTTHVFVPGAPDAAHTLCALLNSLPLEFRYRALGGLGKLTGRGMFEYFENQIADLPIPDFDDPANQPALNALADHSRALHSLFQDRMRVMQAWRDKATGILTRPAVPLARYADLGHAVYGKQIAASSPNAALAGELLSMRVEIQGDVVAVHGLITDPDDDDAPRTWLPVLHLRIKHNALRNLILAHLVFWTEFDETFRRKRALGKGPSVFELALQAVAIPEFDHRDGERNLAIIDNVAAQVAEIAGRSDVDAILADWAARRRAIDDLALSLYGVAEHRATMEAALAVVL